MPPSVTRALRKDFTLGHLAVITVVFWLPIVLFAQLANEVKERSTVAFDDAVLLWVHHFATPGLDQFFLGVTNVGGPVGTLAATVVSLLVLLRAGRERSALALLLSVGGAIVVDLILKIIFQRARPDLWARLVTENTYSFPSGHAMMSSALAFSLVAILWRTRYRWPATLAATIYIPLIGLSRIYLGVHFLTDIVAGWCVSLAWVAIVFAVIYRLQSRER